MDDINMFATGCGQIDLVPNQNKFKQPKYGSLKTHICPRYGYSTQSLIFRIISVHLSTITITEMTETLLTKILKKQTKQLHFCYL